jgi:hypothetical protein
MIRKAYNLASFTFFNRQLDQIGGKMMEATKSVASMAQ